MARPLPDRSSRGRSLRAFTLFEVVLALSLLAVLVGIMVIGVAAMGHQADLDAGANRLATALRMAGADAANFGRRIRLSPNLETGGLDVLWETQPLVEPGVFTEYTTCTWKHYLPLELVRIQRCELTGDSAYRTLTFADGEATESETGALLEPITFYPDMSSDSAVIELAAARSRDQRIAVVTLDGVNAVVSTALRQPGELEETQ